ncbi:extracellular solute-binding protein [Tessaracoccus rhinocerotis]|uniref:Extracellular solute-binding protein n=1 Tax=Tessaracoccus rhinocerotis TaxID=1689449 RepID=A0A553K5H9_9ACTN|nr:extracellular solute-binding protein [Tessaracoccus rhinocerotis]TRY19963.1 extracellular solute-binding protein [Tessaracoccus rhinocerotis]
MKKRRILGIAAAASMLLTACGGATDGPGDGATTGGGDTTTAQGEDVTLRWWHNSNTGDGKDYYDKVAADFEAANPGVTIEVSAMQHEDMLTKLEAAWQSGDVPEVYMERGGGELVDKVEVGLVKDLTDLVPETIETVGGSAAGWQVDGRTYALPFSIGVVGFWYNTELFEQAGIEGTPETMADLYDAVDKLKAAGIEPISVGAGSKWPAAHYWYYFALRQCSAEVIDTATTTLDFSDPCFIRAGESLQELVAAEPFNAGFLTTEAQSGPTSASGLLATGKVAMELAGHWEPGVMQGLTEDGTGLGDATGWFPFPAVDGGEGDPSFPLGGGDAWGVPETAPQQAVDFVEYLLSDEIQQGFAELDMGLPTNPNATEFVQDEALAALLEVRDSAERVQLYLDTAFGTSVGGAMNDEIALVFAGQSSPQGIVDAIQQAADAEK